MPELSGKFARESQLILQIAAGKVIHIHWLKFRAIIKGIFFTKSISFNVLMKHDDSL